MFDVLMFCCCVMLRFVDACVMFVSLHVFVACVLRVFWMVVPDAAMLADVVVASACSKCPADFGALGTVVGWTSSLVSMHSLRR